MINRGTVKEINMERDLQEQACWLLLVFESGLSTRLVNDILVAWCHQNQRPLQEFFAASPQEWSDACQLKADSIQKLEQAREKLVGQAFLVEQLAHNHIHILTVLDADYPKLLRTSLKREQTPPVLFYAGDLRILERKTIAIIGSRNAGEESLAFTRAVSGYLAERGANVISGNARGVDRTAYEGANGALKQHRPLYVRQSDGATTLPGNKALIELGGQPLAWPVENVAHVLAPLLEESAVLQQQKQEASPRPDQLSLFAVSNEA